MKVPPKTPLEAYIIAAVIAIIWVAALVQVLS